MTKIKKARRVMLIILASILAILIALFCVLLAWSPGKIAPYRNENGGILAGSVAEIVRTEIGGTPQGLIIKSKSDQNPVLLFLHGGPGNPEYVLAKNYDIGLEDYIKVKDASGNVSNALKIVIPAYAPQTETTPATPTPTTPTDAPDFSNIVITGGTVVYLNPDFSGIIIKFGNY